MTFSLPDADTGDNSPGSMTVTVGVPDYGMPLVFEETLPAGTQFASASPTVAMTNYPVAALTATMLYSTDSGANWSATPPAVGITSTGPNNLIKIQWLLPEGITSPVATKKTPKG